MKIKDSIEKCFTFLIVSAIFIIALPFILLFFFFKLLMTPFDYVKYKKSRYQQDFPHKYTWLSDPHMDNEPYTAIKENNLPVEYIKWREEYDLSGYFVYKDILLVFDEPFFFDKRRGLRLIWPSNSTEDFTDSEDEGDYENTDDCLTVEEAKKYILETFHSDVSGYRCNRAAFFYSRKNIENNYEEGGLEKMRALDDFIVYEKGELALAIKEFIENN